MSEPFFGGRTEVDFDWSTLNVTDGGERTTFCFGVVVFFAVERFVLCMEEH